jgi:hypothetical protein
MQIIQDNAHFLFGTGHSSRRKGKYRYDQDKLAKAVKAIPLKSRMTVCNLAGEVAIPTTTIQRFLRPTAAKVKVVEEEQSVLLRHSSNIRPTLTEQTRSTVLSFVLKRSTLPHSTSGIPCSTASMTRSTLMKSGFICVAMENATSLRQERSHQNDTPNTKGTSPRSCSCMHKPVHNTIMLLKECGMVSLVYGQ